MNKNPLKVLFEHHQTAINCWVNGTCSITTELLSHQGFDSITLDIQHGLMGYEQAVSQLQSMASTDVTPLVRVPWLEPGIIMKMLDAGAMGIICPMIETAEQTRAFINCCLYPPAGQRSYGPLRAELCYGSDYAQHANESILPIVMIETREALDNLEAILSEPHLGGIYVGPFDLSYALGCTPKPDDYEPPVLDAIDHILNCCKQHGVPAGIHCIQAEQAVLMRQKGFSLVTAGSDIGYLASGIKQTFEVL